MRRLFETILALPGVVLLALALGATPDWFDRHVVVPAYYLPPPRWLLPALRAVCVLGGLLFLLLLRPLAGRAGARLGVRAGLVAAARIALALVLAVGAAELALRLFERPDLQSRRPRLESRLGQDDPRLGWTLTPRHTAAVQSDPHLPRITYASDAFGDRAPFAEYREDPARPTIVLTGESIAYGHGLEWRDTVAARLEELTGAQVITVAVPGYGSDQAFLRAADALLRLQRPLAVVTFVLPVQLSRNLHDDRPRLALRDGALVALAPERRRLRLRDLFVNEVRLLSEARLQESLLLTHAILAATAQAAAARGARALFVEPSFGGPPPSLMTGLLADLPHRPVQLDSARLLPYDGHPDAQGARELAAAIAQALAAQ